MENMEIVSLKRADGHNTLPLQLVPHMIVVLCWIALYTGFHFALSPWSYVPSC